ncbi:MAG TPA: MauE/DoxX family redox-associated membrane protein [Bryobacteraceae bacterium]|nr:MauE/DoxX family redox-associated membrane protein [Bryobacteraceae bacterium]
MTFSNRARWAFLVLRIALGAVFAYAAYIKLTQPWELFAGAIADYKLLPAWAVNPLARTLPWAELAIGLLLVAGFLVRTASAACSLLLLVFFSLMVRAYAFHMEISCGCFGPGELISWKTLLRDGSLLAVALAVTALSFWRKRAPAASGETRP